MKKRLKTEIDSVDAAEIHKLYAEGYGAPTIARLLKLSQGPVIRYMKENDLYRTREEAIERRKELIGGFGHHFTRRQNPDYQ